MTEEITHGKVVGRVLRASNTTPEVEPDPTYAAIPSARVEFKAQLPTPWFKALMSSDPTSVFLQTFWAETDDDGYIVDAAGNHGIMLPASVDPSLGYSEWVWRATIKTAVAATVAVDFVLPAFTAEGDEVDVTTVARVPADPGRELGAWDALYLRARNQVARVQAAGSAAVADIEDAAGGVEQRAVAAATAAAADYTVQSGQARDEARSAASDAAAVVDTVTAQAQHATAEASRAKAEADRAQGAADSIDVTLSTEATAGTVPVRGAGGVLPGIGAPVSGTDAATKQYVDSVVPADHAWQALVLNPGLGLLHV
ncbi:hypothetical protein D9V30_00005 [Mycetocola reblochoni]|uniref:Uncharacterized protein n=2 Tax=Mycetocola reblochoni TaxID=331618 RepID=A0A3L6ZSC9_9MICO|nr:hypothetical protein D9V30_00005 [Mycetocola reblochoni]